ncbi:MAG: ankyrin repeat domain-containing protein [Myxococcaceae bacterium]|nr:MAG: ankyrin repeat domain-containing protein [Myxococcaceae bacterium]
MDPLHTHSVQKADGSFPEYLLHEHQVYNEENRALFFAAAEGNLKEVQVALRKGGKPNFFYRPEDQKNALHVASERGYLDVMQALLDAGAQVNALAAKDHSTPLILAATLADPAPVRLLLSRGASVHAGEQKNIYLLRFIMWCCLTSSFIVL